MPCHAVCTRTEACGCGVRTPAHDPVWSCREVSPVLTAMCYDSFERPTRQFSDDSLRNIERDHFKRRVALPHKPRPHKPLTFAEIRLYL